MVNYKCPRCGYEINIKTKYMNHLRRKNLCKATISNSDLQNEYIKYGINDKIVSSVNYCKSTVNHCKNHNIPTNDHNNPTNNHNNSLQSTNIKCEYCKKNYSRIDSLNRHLKTCKEKIGRAHV